MDSISLTARNERVKDLYNGIFVVTIIAMFFRFLFRWLLSLSADKIGTYPVSLLTVVLDGIAFLFPFFVWLKLRRDKISDLFPRRGIPFFPTALGCLSSVGLALGGCTATMGLLWLVDRDGHGLHSSYTLPDFGGSAVTAIVYAILSGVIYGAVFEFCYRGVSFRFAEEENRFLAIVTSTIAFTFCEFHVLLLLPRLLLGILLGNYRAKHRSLCGCMLISACGQAALTLVFSEKIPLMWLGIFGGAIGLAGLVAVLLSKGEARERDSVPTPLAFRLFLRSFGVWLVLVMAVFTLLVSTFSTDSDPDDPLLQPTPEEGYEDPVSFNRELEMETEDKN